ncbi:hypothetical protein HDV00_003934 [Rhizophlyctis rosea]|nr:hypothetical protein HDV00_003934 [Rhizophlyctis rosea]
MSTTKAAQQSKGSNLSPSRSYSSAIELSKVPAPTTPTPAPKQTGGAGAKRVENDYDKQLRAGLDLIHEAYERRTSQLNGEVTQWKQVAANQRQQIAKLESDIERLKSRGADLERALATQLTEKKVVIASRNALLDRYNALRKNATQLESFRKSIVTMVEHVPSGNVPELERSFVDGNTTLDQQSALLSGAYGGGIVPSASFRGVQEVIDGHDGGNDYAGRGNESFLDARTLQSFDLGGQTLDYSLFLSDKDRSLLAGRGEDRIQQQQQQQQRRTTLPSPALVFTPQLLQQLQGSRAPQVASARQREQTQAQQGVRRAATDARPKEGKGRPVSFSADVNPGSRERHAIPPSASTPNLRNIDTDQPESTAKSSGNDSQNTPTPATRNATQPPTSQPQQQHPTTPPTTIIDAPVLYKQIRDSLSLEDFEQFAANVAAFNASQQTAEETVQRIGKIVKERELFVAMRTLIFTALAESGGEGGGGGVAGGVGGDGEEVGVEGK